MSTAAITLGMQTSGDDRQTRPHVLEFRKLLAEICRGSYSPDIDEFALIFRIGGKFQSVDFVGCQRLRRNRKGRYITVDLGFPETDWKGRPDPYIREFVLKSVEEGLKCCSDRLEKDNAEFKSESLRSDLARVRKLYIAGCD